jgi:CubicO group peptidase (beta-lactamase class C family)
MDLRPLGAILPALLAGCSGVESGPAELPTPAARQARTLDAAELAAVVDPVFATVMQKEGIPGAAFVVVKDGRVVLAKGYGVADVASQRPVRADETLFPYASISKVFTATAVMQLVESGRIALDAPVDTYLKSVRLPATYPQPITVAQLLSHTSGLDEIPGRRVRKASDVVSLSAFLSTRLKRVHPPGEMTSYSTYGIALAGLMVEDVSGQPFEGYLRQHIWDKLGMSRTSITVPPQLRAKLATAYETEDGKLTAVPYEVYQTPPASSIVGTAEDMARFMVAHLQNGRAGDGRILNHQTAQLMHRQYATMHPDLPGWTLGFQADAANGRRIIEHGGDIGGFSALMTLMPDEGVGIFTVHHLESRDLRFDVRAAVLDQFFPAAQAPQPPAPLPETQRTAARFVGKYRANIFCHSCTDGDPNIQDFDVVANPDGTLTLWGQTWVQQGPLLFVRADGRRKLGFAEDESGRIFAVSNGSWRVLERI